MVASLLKAPILGDSVMLAQYIVARQEFYLYGVCVGYRNVWNRTKRIAGNLPGTDGGQTAPASFTHGAPGAERATESTVESGLEVAARHEGVLPGQGFRRGFSDASRSASTLAGCGSCATPIPPRPWGAWSRPTPSARGSKRGCQNPFYHPPQHGTLGEVDERRMTGLVQVRIGGKRIDRGNQDRIQLVSQAA